MDFHFKPTELALWSAACGTFGWLLKSHLSSGCDGRKQSFRAALSDIRERFNLVRDDLLVDAHAQSLPRIREECAKVRNDLGRRKRDALDAAVTAYSGLTRNDIENRDLAAKRRAGSDVPPQANYSLGRTRVGDLINEMIKQAD